jgi:peptide/nickel transport system substrate-binding protein
MDEQNYWRAGAGRLGSRTLLRGAGLAGVGLAGAALIGCGGSDDESSPTASGGASATASSAATLSTPDPSAPVVGGKLRMGMNSVVPHLDPHMSTTPASQWISYHQTGNQLIRLNASSLLLEPDLADSWEVSDGTTFIFKLNPNAKWDDDDLLKGRQITADDCVYSFGRIGTDDPLFARRSQYNGINFEAVDATTLKVTLPEPSVPFLATLGDLYETMVAHEVVEKYGDLRRVEASHGGGPFIVDKSTFDAEIGGRYTRNPNYFKKSAAGDQLPFLDEFEFKFIADAAGLYAALKTGEIDYGAVPAENVQDFQSSRPDWQLFETPGLVRNGVLLNLEKPPFDDPRVRQALSMVLDRYLMGELEGGGRPTTAVPPALAAYLLPPEELAGLPGYRHSDDKAGKEADLAEAKKLLAAAGFADGLELNMQSTAAYNYVDVATTTMPQWESELGVKVNLELIEWGVLTENAASGNFDSQATKYYSGPEPDAHLYLYHHSKGGRNYSHLNDAELDGLIEKQRVEFDQEARVELVREIQRKQIALAAPIWTTSTVGFTAASPAVRNMGARPVSAQYNNETVWLDS